MLAYFTKKKQSSIVDSNINVLMCFAFRFYFYLKKKTFDFEWFITKKMMLIMISIGFNGLYLLVFNGGLRKHPDKPKRKQIFIVV